MDHGKPGARLRSCDKVSFVEGHTASPSTKRHDQEVYINITSRNSPYTIVSLPPGGVQVTV